MWVVAITCRGLRRGTGGMSVSLQTRQNYISPDKGFILFWKMTPTIIQFWKRKINVFSEYYISHLIYVIMFNVHKVINVICSVLNGREIARCKLYILLLLFMCRIYTYMHQQSTAERRFCRVRVQHGHWWLFIKGESTLIISWF